MAAPVIQPNLNGGELAAGLWARVDLAKFHAGMALARNAFVDYQGGVSNRAGTQYVGRARNSSYVHRLIPFTYSTVQTYALLFGHQSLRVIKNGAFVLEASIAITGISNANPGVITAANGYSNGDEVYITGITGPAALAAKLNGRNFYAANVTAANFTLTDLWGTAIDTTALGAWTGGGTVARVYTPTTPYLDTDLALLKFSQNANTMTLTHPSYGPYLLTRSADNAWSFTAATFAASTAAPAGAPTVTPSAAGTTTYNYVVTALIDGRESIASAIGTTAAGAAMIQTAGAHNTIDWSTHLVANADAYHVYRQAEVSGGAPQAGMLFGYVGATDGSTGKFVDQNILPDFTHTPPLNHNPFAANNNPYTSTFYQQRLVFGGNVNDAQGLVLSQTGDYLNMDYSTPSRDSDEIEASLVSNQVNAIKHLVAMNSLIVLTASGAWKIDGGNQSDAITPSSLHAVPQAYNGCSDVPPLTINYDILYVQAKGSIVRDLAYNFYVNIYTGSDISLLSSHLFRGHQILEWAWAEEPHKLVWCVREDGTALTLTYVKEQEIYGWTRHDTNGLFESVCTISEGQENAVYFVVKRLVNGQYVRYVERLASRLLGSDPNLGVPVDWSKAWFVDCGLQYPLTYPTGTLSPATGFTQADDTELYDGTSAIGSVTVTNGGSGYTAPVITVTDPTGSGAVLAPTVVGGVITAVTVTNGGSGYTNPTLKVTDSTGSGATLAAALQKLVTFTAGSYAFSSADIGSVLRTNGGMGTVTAGNGAQVTVNLTRPLRNLWQTASGNWSLTVPVTSVSGLYHLEGQTVKVLADGNVLPDQVVTNGSITLPEAATAIVAGLKFRSRVQSLYLDVGGEPTVQGKRKNLPAITLRVADTRGLKAGPTWDALQPFKQRTNQIPMGRAIDSITGDMRVNMNPRWRTEGQVCIQQDDPLPFTILGFIPEAVVGDT